MKKQLFIAGAAILVLGTAKAENYSFTGSVMQNNTPDSKAINKPKPYEVSEMTKLRFNEDFGYITNVAWTRLKTHSYDFDRATFMWNGKETNAYYDYDNKLIGTTNVASFEDLPAKAQKEIKEKYKDFTTGSVIFFDDNEFNDTDMELYNTPFEDEDNYFVELSKPDKKIVLRVNNAGFVSYFTQIK